MASNVIMREISIAANAVLENFWTGSAFEYLRSAALLSQGFTASAAGLVLTLQSGSQVILEESPIYVATRFPIQPDEMFFNFRGEAGDRIVARIRNSTGGALTARGICQQAS